MYGSPMIPRCVKGATLDEMPATDFVHEIEIRVSQARIHAFLCALDANAYVSGHLECHPALERAVGLGSFFKRSIRGVVFVGH